MEQTLFVTILVLAVEETFEYHRRSSVSLSVQVAGTAKVCVALCLVAVSYRGVLFLTRCYILGRDKLLMIPAAYPASPIAWHVARCVAHASPCHMFWALVR